MSCAEVARLLGDAPRKVQLWVRRFEEQGLTGLLEDERRGRPSRLSEAQLKELQEILRRSAADVGMTASLWDGKLTRKLCLHNRYFPELEMIVQSVERNLCLWRGGDDTLRRSCATT